MSDTLTRPMTRRAFCAGAGALTLAGCGASEKAEAEEEGGALSSVLRFFARMLGRSASAGAGGAAAAAVAKSDPRPCPDLDERIRLDRVDLAKRERVIEVKDGELMRLEDAWAREGGAPDDALITARHKQENRRGWFKKDIRTHRADVASFNARCVSGEHAMAPHDSYVPVYMGDG